MKVVEEAAAAADHGEEAAAGGEVLDGLLEVGGEVVDPVREDGDLDVRGAGVLLVQAVAGDDLTFRGGGHNVIEYPMKNRLGVNVLGLKGFRWHVVHGAVIVFLAMVGLGAAQEAGWKV